MKRLLSILLCVTLLLSIVPCYATYVSAASPSQLTDGVTYNVSWDSRTETKYLYLTVRETGFYDLCIKDLQQIEYADVWFSLTDLGYSDTQTDVDDYGYDYYSDKAIQNYRNIQLISGHLYEIELEYLWYSSNLKELIPIDAAITINFTKNDYEPIVLNLGAYRNVWDSAEDCNWFEFETTTAGDYYFYSSQYTSTMFTIFEKDTGTSVSTEAFLSSLGRTKRIALKANTKYMIFAHPDHYTEARYINLSISKAPTDVLKIEIVQNNTILADDGYVDYDDQVSIDDSCIESFDYRVSFSNNTKQTFSYDELLDIGIWVRDIDYDGEIETIDGDPYFAVGYQPVTIQYMNTSSESRAYITSYVEWLSDIRITTDFEDMSIAYEDEEEKTYFWRIKPNQTNMYAFYSNDWNEISAHYIIFDKKNQVVPYVNESWNLQGGKEYALQITYVYKDSYGLDVVFWMEPDRDHVHTYGKYITNKNGSRTRTCTKCGATQTVSANPFKDVKKSDFYYAPVLWAVENGITSGTSKTTFSPNEACTRGQIATFLWRAAGQPAPKTSSNPFKDVKKNDYYYKAVLWAVGQGITSGTSKTTFSPADPCTRGQIATFLWRANSSKKVNAANPFKDVKKSDYYYNAVLWAVKNGITAGTTPTTFAPNDSCTRGQIATFLYRNYN